MKIFFTGSVDIKSSAYIVSLRKDDDSYIATITLDWGYKKIYLQDRNNKVNTIINVNKPEYTFDDFPSDTRTNFKSIRAEINTKFQHLSNPFKYFQNIKPHIERKELVIKTLEILNGINLN